MHRVLLYLGESGLGRWYFRDVNDKTMESYGAPFPCHGSDCGDVDICGTRKAISHYRNIVWDRGEKLYLGVRQPVPEGKDLHVTRWGVYPVYASWTWPGMEGKPLEVEVYSRAESVRLYLGEKMIGEKPTTRAEKFKANFTVPYAPGSLKAVALSGGRAIAESTLRTAGEAAQLRLAADRATIQADGQDLSFITVEAVDAAGQLHPHADHPVSFTIEGQGSIAAVGNGDLFSEEPYQGSQRKLFRGKALVVIRAPRNPGALTLTATAAGLKKASVRIASRRVG
jgi:beta-galactosidase